MEEITKIVQLDQDNLLLSIDAYQAEIIIDLLDKTSNDYLISADYWLNASTANTAKFGGGPSTVKIYREKLFEELEKFICGGEQYESDRKKITESADKSQKYIIGVMSIAIGKTLGSAGVFIAPVIVLLILSMSKMAVNAWCAMRKDIKTSMGDDHLHQ